MTATAAPHPLTLQMLTWLVRRPRTYDETMDAWRTSCPRFSIWEDALADQLILISHASDARAGQRSVMVELTTEGQAMLNRFAPP
jgi:hypothetical protein